MTSMIQELANQLTEEMQPLLDIINSEGAELAEVAPGDAGLRVEDIINRDNKRFDNLRDQIEKRAQKVQLARQRSSEVSGDSYTFNQSCSCLYHWGRVISHILNASSDNKFITSISFGFCQLFNLLLYFLPSKRKM